MHVINSEIITLLTSWLAASRVVSHAGMGWSSRAWLATHSLVSIHSTSTKALNTIKNAPISTTKVTHCTWTFLDSPSDSWRKGWRTLDTNSPMPQYQKTDHKNTSIQHAVVDPKPAPLAISAAKFLSTEKVWLAASTAKLSLWKIRRKILHVQHFRSMTCNTYVIWVMCNTSAIFQPKMLVVSLILAICLLVLITIIWISRISAKISFQLSGTLKKFGLGVYAVADGRLCPRCSQLVNSTKQRCLTSEWCDHQVNWMKHIRSLSFSPIRSIN